MPTMKQIDVPETLQANPLLQEGELPLYHLVEAQHVEPAMELVLTEAAGLLKQVESDPSIDWDHLIMPLEKIEALLEKVWGAINHLLAVRNRNDLREVHEKLQPKVVQFGLKLGQSETLYEKFNDLKGSEMYAQMSRARQRVVELRLRDAKLAGVGLKGLDRKAFNELAEKISQAGTKFSNHVLDATKAYELIVTDQAATEGWPESLKQISFQSYCQSKTGQADASASSSSPAAGPWRITLDYPVYVPFMQHCVKREMREEVYKAFVSRAGSGELSNSDLILDILKWRKKQAALLGFGSYAEVSLAAKMAPSIDAVDEMHQSLLKVSRPKAQEELEELRTFAAENGQTETLMNWDVAYWSERLREEQFGFSDEMLRPYFPLERVLEGMFDITRKLFNVEVAASTKMTQDESHRWKAIRWHEDIQLYDVFDLNQDRKLIARFFLDPYARPEEKRGGAWMDVCNTRRMEGDDLVLPVVQLVCNGTPPVSSEEKTVPSLMSFNEAETLFHEFGHGLQGMLSIQDEADVSGIGGVEWDAVEIASQFMENWLYEPDTLKNVAKHYETGESLPEDLMSKVIGARNFRVASVTLRQLQFGMVDLALHSADPDADGWNPFEIESKLINQIAVMKPIPEDKFLCGFSHIFAGGYAAGYYSYKWSEVLSADVFAAFQEAGLDNEEQIKLIGQKYRDTFLALGGGEDPMVVFTSFREREPSVDPLLKQAGLIS